jgi:hypothetical protein
MALLFDEPSTYSEMNRSVGAASAAPGTSPTTAKAVAAAARPLRTRRESNGTSRVTTDLAHVKCRPCPPSIPKGSCS